MRDEKALEAAAIALAGTEWCPNDAPRFRRDARDAVDAYMGALTQAAEASALADRLGKLVFGSCTCKTLTTQHPPECPTAILQDCCAYLREVKQTNIVQSVVSCGEKQPDGSTIYWLPGKIHWGA